MIAVSTPKELIAAAAKGGAIGVNPGHYGALRMSGIKPPVPAVLNCAPGVHFESVTTIGTDNVAFHNPQIFPLAAPAAPNAFLFDADMASSGISLHNALVLANADAKNYRNWTSADWAAAKKTFGVWLRGAGSSMVGCSTYGLRVHGQISGDGGLITGCKMRGTSNDMIHAIGHATGYSISGNDMADFVLIDGTHNDAIQMWSTDAAGNPGQGMMRNVLINKNLIREWIGPRPALCHGTQGATAFKGNIDGIEVSENEIWNGYGKLIGHGITLNKVVNALIEKNRVMNFDRDQKETSPWISATGNGITIRNNVVAKVTAPGATVSANVRPNYATEPMMSLVD